MARYQKNHHLINLLSPKEKEELRLENNKKLAIVLGNVVLISLICLVLVLLSVKFYILEKFADQKATLDNAQEEYQISDFLSMKESAQKYKSLIIKVDNFYKKEAYLSDVLKKVLFIQKPKGVYLKTIDLTKDYQENKIKISISGQSDTRDNLLIFKDNVVKEEGLENAFFPPDTWVKYKDINFILTLESR